MSMDLKNGTNINIDKLLNMSVKDKATAYFCGYVDNYAIGLPTEITHDMAKMILSSIKGKGVSTFKKYETLHNTLRRAIPDFIGSRYSLVSTTSDLKFVLTLLSQKETTAKVLSKVYLLLDKIDRRQILDEVTLSAFAEKGKNEYKVSIENNNFYYEMKDEDLFLCLGDTDSDMLRYNIDSRKFIEEKVSPLIDDYNRKVGNIKGVVEAITEWIRINGAECIVGSAIEESFDAIKDSYFYEDIFKFYSPSAVEEAMQKGDADHLSPSRIYISKHFSIPTYEESPVNESWYNKVIEFLG